MSVGLLLVTCRNWLNGAGDATVTVPSELPPSITELGNSVSEMGTGACALTVSCDCALRPFQLAVIVAMVLVVTEFVGMENGAEELPAGTATVGGGLAAGELLERLTTAPPAEAWPFSCTIPPAWAPPLMVLGVIVSDFSEGGNTVKSPEADVPLRVAVSVTGVGTVTCPACI